jgi:hypothetical protein
LRRHISKRWVSPGPSTLRRDNNQRREICSN